MNAPPCQHRSAEVSFNDLGVRGQYEVVARQTVWEEVNNPVSLTLAFQEKG